MLSLNELVLFFPHHVMVELCYFCMHAHYVTLLFSLNNSFVVRSCKNVVTLLINFLCYVVFCRVVLCCVVLCCGVLCCSFFFVLHLCCVASIHYHRSCEETL